MLMSAALPGWGQLYNGELNKAIWWGLGFFCLTIPSTVAIGSVFAAGIHVRRLYLEWTGITRLMVWRHD